MGRGDGGLQCSAPCRVCLRCPQIILAVTECWRLQQTSNVADIFCQSWLTPSPPTLSTGTEHPGDQSCNNMCKLLPTWNWGRGHIERIISTVSSQIMSIQAIVQRHRRQYSISWWRWWPVKMHDDDGLSSLTIQGLSTVRRDSAARAETPIIKYPLITRRMEHDSCPPSPQPGLQTCCCYAEPSLVWRWWIMIIVSGSKHRSCILLICSLQYSSSPPASRLQPRVEQLYWGTFNWKPTAVWRFQDENISTSNFTRKYFWNNFHLSLFVSRAGGWWLCDIFKFSLSVHWERECFALLGSSHSVHWKLRKRRGGSRYLDVDLERTELVNTNHPLTEHYTLHCTAQ